MALTTEQLQKAAELRKAMWAYSKIARSLGCSKNMLIGAMTRAGLAKDSARRVRTPKPAARPEPAARATAPAAGIVRRERLRPSPKAVEPRRPSPKAVECVARASAPAVPVAPVAPIAEALTLPRDRSGATDGARGVTLLALREGQCKFPSDDPRPADLTFCGERSDEGCVYCATHRAISYTKPQKFVPRSHSARKHGVVT